MPVADHFCQYIVDWRTEPGEDGDPVFCDKPASIKYVETWLCAGHYDEVFPSGEKALDKRPRFVA